MDALPDAMQLAGGNLETPAGCGVREFIKRYFHTCLEDPENYDLAIRTEHLSFDTAASLVTNALSSLSPSLSKAGPQEG